MSIICITKQAKKAEKVKVCSEGRRVEQPRV